MAATPRTTRDLYIYEHCGGRLDAGRTLPVRTAALIRRRLLERWHEPRPALKAAGEHLWVGFCRSRSPLCGDRSPARRCERVARYCSDAEQLRRR